MALEHLVSFERLQERPVFGLLLGLIFSLIGIITASFLFPHQLASAALFLIALLLVPSLGSFLTASEIIERKEGLKHFWYNHTDIIAWYLYLTIGVFIGYFISAWFIEIIGSDATLLSEYLSVFGTEITRESITSFHQPLLIHGFSIFSANVSAAIILFLLSLFYGAGAIFLIVRNAGIFASFLYTTLQNISHGVPNSITLFGIFSLYIFPELIGFLFVAIAGGVVSKAFTNETLMSVPFKNVLLDAIVLLIVGFVFLLLAAFLESSIALPLVQSLV
jgi:hypothetical protein